NNLSSLRSLPPSPPIEQHVAIATASRHRAEMAKAPQPPPRPLSSPSSSLFAAHRRRHQLSSPSPSPPHPAVEQRRQRHRNHHRVLFHRRSFLLIVIISFFFYARYILINMNNVKVLNVLGGGLSALLKVSIFGGLAVYGAANSLYNVEGGHRAIVFNRIVGVKDK
ncbi:hypothetical protein S245_040008, partial [Arachis hypogaea]